MQERFWLQPELVELPVEEPVLKPVVSSTLERVWGAEA